MATPRMTSALQAFKDSLVENEKEAFDKICKEQCAIDAVELTTQLDELDAKRKSRVIARRVSRVLESLQQYCVVVDAAVNGSQLAALIWSAVRFFILTASKFSEYFDKLSKRLAQISTYCPRLSEYQHLFRDSLRLQAAIGDFYALIIVFCSQAMKSLQNKAPGQGISRYINVVWKSFKRQFREIEENMNAARERIEEEIQLASEQRLGSIDERLLLEQGENQAHRLAQADETKENRIYRCFQLLKAVEDHKHRCTQEGALASIEQLQHQKALQEQERHKIRLMRALVSEYHYESGLRQALRTKLAGTGDWVMETEKYAAWREDNETRCLWCTGIPGSGKTIIAASVVEHLAAEQPLYYFFSATENVSLSPIIFLRCLLHQILRYTSLLPQTQAKVEDIVFRKSHDTFQLDRLEGMVLENYQRISAKTIIIDGFDELPPKDQRYVSYLVSKLHQQTKHTRFFTTVGPDLDTNNIIKNAIDPLTIEINAQNLYQDISLFVSQTLIDERNNGPLQVCGEDILDRIKQELVSKAGSMFLWVHLQLRAICDVVEDDGTSRQVPYMLDNLPKDIVDMYTQCFQKVVGQNPERLETVKRIFMWVVAARRSLRLSELEDAISITPGQSHWTEPSVVLSPSRLSKHCRNLVIYDSAELVVRIAHHSVLAFMENHCQTGAQLRQFQLEPSIWNSYLGSICLTYLSFRDFTQTVAKATSRTDYTVASQPLATILPIYSSLGIYKWSNKLLQRERNTYAQASVVNQLRSMWQPSNRKATHRIFPFLEYCKANWHLHTLQMTPNEVQNFKLLRQLLLEAELPFQWQPWDTCCEDMEPFQHWAKFCWSIDHGHVSALQIVEKDGMGKNSSEAWKHFWSACGPQSLILASSTNAQPTLDILLSSPYHENVVRASLSECLEQASAFGHWLVVEKLIEEGMKLGEISHEHRAGLNYYHTALEAARRNGHTDIAERLLRSVQEITTGKAVPPGTFHVAMDAATTGGHVSQWTQLLAQKRAIPGAIRALTPLQLAVLDENRHLVERLLRDGALPDEYDPWGDPPLWTAVKRGNLTILNALLAAGCNVNIARREEGIHYQEADKPVLANYDLSEKGQNFTTDSSVGKGVPGITALHIAARCGHCAIVERLCEAGANKNAKNDKGTTPLHWAAGTNQTKVIPILLEAGADIDAQRRDGGTPLHWAVEMGHLLSFQQLLDANADLEVQDNRGFTALWIAAYYNHDRLLHDLIALGASADGRDNSGQTILHVAATRGHCESVKLLLDCGVQIDEVDHYQDSALHWAAVAGHIDVINLLVARGAMVNRRDKWGRTALYRAAEKGRFAVVSRLIESNAKVNLKLSKDKPCSLCFAVSAGNEPAVRMLLEAGAEISRTYDGQTLVQIATDSGHDGVVRLLREAGAPD